jgi:nitrogen regulatory protein PII
VGCSENQSCVSCQRAQIYDAVVASVSGGATGESLVWMSDVQRASFVRKVG